MGVIWIVDSGFSFLDGFCYEEIYNCEAIN